MKTIYLDLDGPILDVAPKFYRIYSDIMHRHGHEALDQSTYWNLKRVRTPIPDIIQRTAPERLVEIYIKERLEVIETIDYLKYDRLQPGITKLLVELKQRCRLVLVTLRNIRKSLDWELDHFDMRRHFDTILSEDENHGDYRIKMKLIRQYSGNKQPGVAIVGDTESDIKAGQELGLTTIATTEGIRTREYLEALNPDFIVSGTDEMRRVLIEELVS